MSALSTLTLLIAASCPVPGAPARWATEVCGPKGCPERPKFEDACSESEYWKRRWCEAYVKQGGQVTVDDCVVDRALVPASIEEPVTERDVKLDGRACKQAVRYFSPGKHLESRIRCGGVDDGAYERWTETGARYIQGGFAAGMPAGAWTLYGPGDRVGLKIIYNDGHAGQRVPPAVPSKDGAFEVFLMTAGSAGKSALRVEADGKVTLAAHTQAEAFVDDAAYDALQKALAAAWAALSGAKPCDGKSAKGAPEQTIAVRRGSEIRRMMCVGPLPDALAAVFALAGKAITAPGTPSGDVLAVTGVKTDEQPGALDFPRRAQRAP